MDDTGSSDGDPTPPRRPEAFQQCDFDEYLRPPANIRPPTLKLDGGDVIIELSSHPCDRLLLHSDVLKERSHWFALQFSSFNAPRKERVDGNPSMINPWTFGMKLYEGSAQSNSVGSTQTVQAYILSNGVNILSSDCLIANDANTLL